MLKAELFLKTHLNFTFNFLAQQLLIIILKQNSIESKDSTIQFTSDKRISMPG